MATVKTRKNRSIKNVKPKEVEHYCTQEEQIRKMSLILVGNGDPKNSVVYRLEAVVDDLPKIKEDIQTIKDHIKDSNENFNVLIKEITSVGQNFQNFKTKIETENNEKEKTESKNIFKSRDNWYKILTIIGLGVAIYFGFRNNSKQDKVINTTEQTESKVNNLGVPLVTRNGKILALPDSTRIIFFANDSLKYTIKREEK